MLMIGNELTDIDEVAKIIKKYSALSKDLQVQEKLYIVFHDSQILQ